MAPSIKLRRTPSRSTLRATGQETITEAGASGSAYETQVSVRNADGRTGTSQTYEDVGYGLALSRSEVKALNASGSLVDTVTTSASDGSPTGHTVTTTSADGLTKTTQVDPSGAGVFNSTTVTVTARNAAGSSVTTATQTAANSANIAQTVTTTSTDGSSTLTQEDNTGSGTFDTTISDTRTRNPDDTVGELVTTTSANGTLLAKKTIITSADRSTVTTTTANGDGVAIEFQTSVTGADGTVKDTTADYAPNGTLVDKAVKITSANGLSVTTETDANSAANVFNRTTTDVTVINANGSRMRTVSDSNANDTLIDQTITTTSANGLASVQTSNVDSKVDYTTTDATALNGEAARLRR